MMVHEIQEVRYSDGPIQQIVCTCGWCTEIVPIARARQAYQEHLT